MNVRVVFSYNKQIGSTAIRVASFLFDRSGLKYSDIPSHTALLVDNQYIIEAVFSGVRIVPYEAWKRKNIEVASIPVENIRENPVGLINEIWGKSYDFFGLFWFLIAVVEHKILKKELPVVNTWEREDNYFCVEIVGRCLGIANYGTITPAELLIYLLKI